jgi:hypothetical protein
LATHRGAAHIDDVSGYQSETPEETLKRLQDGSERSTTGKQVLSSSLSRSGRATPGVGDEYPVPDVEPAVAYQAYLRGWRPDALAFLHPDLFGGGDSDAQIQVEVAVFALAAAGLIKVSARSWLRSVMAGPAAISGVQGLSCQDISPPGGPMWVSDLILFKVYSPGPVPTWRGGRLYALQERPGRAALELGLASRQKGHWWRRPATVADPRSKEAAEPAARQLADQWWQFAADFPTLNKARRAATKTPELGG